MLGSTANDLCKIAAQQATAEAQYEAKDSVHRNARFRTTETVAHVDPRSNHHSDFEAQ